MYQIVNDRYSSNPAYIKRLSDNAFIPFDNANQDFVRFKLDITNGAELQDADGVAMTAEQVQQFLETLP